MTKQYDTPLILTTPHMTSDDVLSDAPLTFTLADASARAAVPVAIGANVGVSHIEGMSMVAFCFRGVGGDHSSPQKQVLTLGTNEKMRRVDAVGILASVVENHAFRHVADQRFVDGAIGRCTVEIAAPLGANCAAPRPAFLNRPRANERHELHQRQASTVHHSLNESTP